MFAKIFRSWKTSCRVVPQSYGKSVLFEHKEDNNTGKLLPYFVIQDVHQTINWSFFVQIPASKEKDKAKPTKLAIGRPNGFNSIIIF